MSSPDDLIIRDHIHEPLIIDSRYVKPNCCCCYCDMTNKQKDKCQIAWIFIFIASMLAAIIILVIYGSIQLTIKI